MIRGGRADAKGDFVVLPITSDNAYYVLTKQRETRIFTYRCAIIKTSKQKTKKKEKGKTDS